MRAAWSKAMDEQMHIDPIGASRLFGSFTSTLVVGDDVRRFERQERLTRLNLRV